MKCTTDAELLTQPTTKQAVEVAKHLKEAAGAVGSRVNEAASTAGSGTLRTGGVVYRYAKVRIVELESACENYIGQKPGQSLLIGAGFGFLVGLLTRK